MTSARFIPLKDIRRRADAREINRDNVEGIKASIREVGLLSPVIVRHADGNAFELIAGNHRFIAVQELGEPDIMALDLANLDDLHAELAMIDENLRRADPSPAERSAQVVRLLDGTQICMRENVTFTQGSGGFMSFGWTYPAPFVGFSAVPFVVRPVLGGNYTGNASLTSMGPVAANAGSGASTALYLPRVDGAASFTPESTITGCRVAAIGRWF